MTVFLFTPGKVDPLPNDSRRFRVTGRRQISRTEFYRRGGLENTRLFRKASSKGWFTYWEITQ